MYTRNNQKISWNGRLKCFAEGIFLGVVVTAFTLPTYPKKVYDINVNQDGVKYIVTTRNEEDLAIFQSEGKLFRKLESPSEDLLTKVREEIKRLEDSNKE